MSPTSTVLGQAALPGLGNRTRLWSGGKAVTSTAADLTASTAATVGAVSGTVPAAAATVAPSALPVITDTVSGLAAGAVPADCDWAVTTPSATSPAARVPTMM